MSRVKTRRVRSLTHVVDWEILLMKARPTRTYGFSCTVATFTS